MACLAPNFYTAGQLGKSTYEREITGFKRCLCSGGPFCFPENIAVSVATSFSHLMLEIHYDNPTTASSFFDSSGLSLTATSQSNAGVGTIEAGYIWVGEIASISIPPGRSYWEVSATCQAPEELTFNLNVFASILHGHQIATKLFT